MLLAFNKPYGVLCKFMPEPGRPTLADFIRIPRVYPAGRLDHDSEGLLLLTDDGPLQARIADPRHKLAKVYWAQVEGVPTDEALTMLRRGVDLGEFTTRPAPAPPRRGSSTSRPASGRASRRSATEPRSRRAGSSSLCARAATARCGA